MEVVFHHGDHRVLDVLLVLAQLGRHLLLELLGEGLDDDVAVSNLLSIELNEGQETFLGAELAFVIHVLKSLPLNVSKYFPNILIILIRSEGREGVLVSLYVLSTDQGPPAPLSSKQVGGK